MKEAIRRGMFETNSSSVHSLTMCSDDEYSKWKNGEAYFDRYARQIVESTEEIEKERENNGRYSEYLTYDEFWDYDCISLTKFDEPYTTPNGETVHAFGYYGYD